MKRKVLFVCLKAQKGKQESLPNTENETLKNNTKLENQSKSVLMRGALIVEDQNAPTKPVREGCNQRNSHHNHK